ncbi:hypothetical protein FQN51_009521, partial [Onygenales sp. PD_10]
MDHGELWTSLVTAIDPFNAKAMPVVLQSTIDLLETELAKARAALEELQTQPFPAALEMQDTITAGAMAAYKHHLLGRATQITHASALLPVTAPDMPLPVSLVDLLSNSLILDHLAPHLSVSSLLSLASTSTTLRSLIMDTPYVFRHMDLTKCRGAQVPAMGPIDPGGEVWRSERMDESLTEDEFYSGPLRGIFADLGRRSILQDVRTLVLDGLSVTAELIADIILTDRFSVVVLSIRDCLNLNERKLMQTLQYAVRPSRGKGMPRVKGIYHFTPKDAPRTTSHARQALHHTSASAKWDRAEDRQLDSHAHGSSEANDHNDQLTSGHPWYKASGKVIKSPITNGWAQVLKLCEGIISFDAVLCRSPRHDISNSTGSYLPPTIATVALGPRGCEGCHSAPEGPAAWNHSPDHHFPLLAPVPLHSSRIATAKSPVVYPGDEPTLIMQCEECLIDRWCHRCGHWWCAACLPHPEKPRHHRTLHQTASPVQATEESNPQQQKRFASGVSRDCWECGPTCGTCKTEVQRTCTTCSGEYCIEHNDGCSSTK